MKLKILALALALSACVSVHPQSPAQTVYALEATLTTAVKVATIYADLPRCGSGAALCSDGTLVAEINAAAQSAGTAVETAQAIVTSGTASTAAQEQAVASAEISVNALTSLTAKAKVQ